MSAENFSYRLIRKKMGWGNGYVGFWDRLDQICGYGNQKLPLTYNEENGFYTFSVNFIGSLSKKHLHDPGQEEFKFCR